MGVVSSQKEALMSWKEATKMELKTEFVMLADQPNALNKRSAFGLLVKLSTTCLPKGTRSVENMFNH